MCTAGDVGLEVSGKAEDADGSLQDDVAAAEPSIDEKTSKLVSKGRWGVPGYKVRSRYCAGQHLVFANTATGKIRRPLRSIEDMDYAFPLCTLAL